MNPADEIVRHLQRTLGANWDHQRDGDNLVVRQHNYLGAYTPPRRCLDWANLLDKLTAGFASRNVLRAQALPMRWNRDTDFTISAIQALDPYLKDARPIVYRQGFLPQPAVRFTARREQHAELRDGFLTSFVNVSHVQPNTSIADFATIIDGWIGVLSGLGLHARQITIGGDLKVWRRAEIEGITLRIWHAGRELGDAVLLWNADHPSFMATDLGSGLERLRWTISGQPWRSIAFGQLANHTGSAALDAIRTATLIVGSGIQPATRGRGSALRRLLRYVDPEQAALGLGRAVREFHEYWELTTRLTTPWHEVSRVLETELAVQSGRLIPRQRSGRNVTMAIA